MKRIAWLILLAASSGYPQIRFDEIAKQAGIHFQLNNGARGQFHQVELMLGGVAVFDFDNDGCLDIYFTNGAALPSLRKTGPEFHNRLYKNNCNLTFTEVTEKAGVAGDGYSMGAAAADYDNDGYTDIFVAGVNRNILYRNRGDGTFEDVTRKAGLAVDHPKYGRMWATSAGWLDYNNDGKLDLFVSNYVVWNPRTEPHCGAANQRLYCHPDNYQGLPNQLFRNNGDGTFTDVSSQSGIGSHIGKGMGVAFADVNGDGYTDIFVANDSVRSFLFENQRDGTFKEAGLEYGVALREDGAAIAGMGVDVRDMNNDGLPDVFVTGMINDTFLLFRNLGKGKLFADDTLHSRLAVATRQLTGWSAGMYDFDNDGWKDLFSANSHFPQLGRYVGRNSELPNTVFRNLGNGRFEDVSALAGTDFQGAAMHHGAAFGDFDNDGRVDVVVSVVNGPAKLFRNVSTDGNHWLGVLPVGSKNNRDGLGAQVRVTLPDGTVLHNHATTSVGYGRNGRPTTPSQGAPCRGQDGCRFRHHRPDAAGDVRLSFSLGTTLAEWGKYDRAEAAFSRALENDPANVEILHNVGLAALRAGHLDRAQRVFEIALRERPDDVDSMFNLARVHAARGDNETALVLLAQARRLAPDRPDLLLLLARTYAEAGFLSGAAEAYDAYLKLQPDDPSARRERGFAYCRFGRMQTGLPDLNWYVKQYPRDPVGHFELGLCETLGDASQASQHLAEALRLKPDFMPALQARGWLFQRDGKWQEALPYLKSVVEREPNNAMALLQLGRIYLELERPAQAVEFLRRARDLAPEHTGVLKQLHRALRAVKQDREAALVLEKLTTAGPDPTPLKAQAQIFDYMGLDPAQQRERFRRNLTNAIAASPADAELKVQLGAFLLNDAKPEEALAVFREILTLSPAPKILHEAATALLDHKQYSLARKFLTRLVAADPAIENRLDLAVALFHGDGPGASLAEIEKVPLADRTGDVYLLKAQIEDALGRFEDAVRSLNTAFERAPTRGDLYFWASLFLIKHNRDQQALQLLDQATTIVPDDPDLLLTKATLLELERKTSDAEDVLKKIQLRWPEWGRTYLIRGIIQATHRNPEQALQSIQTAIALGERTSSAYYYLADVSRSARPDDRDAAQRAIAEALRLDPADASAHALAGKIALDAGEPARAVEQLHDAIRLKPNLTEAHYSLSMAYKKLGREEQARAELDAVRRLREQDPHPDDNPAGIRQMLFAGPASR